ncbi:signal peptide peptidase SppA [Horticoccus sp. 23ND18S-11]|uniref:signal peptide peptidase SppA n=1 Tax=Horticoccus sp. 23ND18S-11 TaxID=3391832 RepID=UPI0039C91477
MKNFFTSMLGALVALMIFSVGCALLCIGFLAAMAALGGSQKGTPSFDRGSYLVFDLSTNISDAPPPVDMSFFGGQKDTVQLRTVTRALRAAANDDRIAGVFITGELTPAAFGSGYAALKEVRGAIEDFKASGKPVTAYLTYATTKSYYLASAASELAIDPYGVILMPGLASEPMFFAGAFEKYGINVQVTRVGKYKAAVEPFTRRDMSPENREEVKKLLGDIWSDLLADIGPSRNLTPEKIQATVDAEGMVRADLAKENGWVDRVAYRDEVYDALKAKTGRSGSKEPFKQVTLIDYAKIARDVADVPKKGHDNTKPVGKSGRIAIVYAEGEIVDGEGSPDDIGGTRFSRNLRKLRQDENVKAIVLRVNSPGGSASASEVIQREIRLIKKVKPIVVSMGSYAASGGYWIAAYGDRIFAEPTTITGSIGVFGIQFDVKQLANNFGLTFDSVKTGKFADALTISRPKTPEELAVLQRMVDWIYGEFVGKVAEARQIAPARVEEIAQGRVWSGREAKEIGLVDELGGLDAAIAFAAEKAGVTGNYRLVEYPRQKELIEAIQDLLEGVTPKHAHSSSLSAKIAARIEAELKMLNSFNDPNGIYARMPLSLNLR